MITQDELRILQTRFEPERQANQSRYRELEKLRKEFVSKFEPSQIPLMSLDDYVEGKGSKESFCYWVEWKTADLGHIQGSNASKFGVFFDKKRQSYEFISRFESEGAAVGILREEISRLLEAGSANNLEAIRKVKLSPMFKGKILFLYYPERYLNVFSEDHIDHFLREAGLATLNDEFDVLAKRQQLLAFKADDEVMSKWTTNEFMRFLYHAWPPLPKKSKVPEALKKYVDDEIFPPARSTRSEFVAFELREAIEAGKRAGQIVAAGVIDFEEQNRRNKRRGDQGEEVVYWAERRWLEANGRRDLAKDVDLICRKDPGAGYDVTSFELDGRPKYIEVKATTCKPPAQEGGVRFHISAREFEQAKELPNYYLFIVFDVKSKNPKIWPIRDPAKLTSGPLRLQPSAYYATLTATPPKG
jgi:hypothetical protein